MPEPKDPCAASCSASRKGVLPNNKESSKFPRVIVSLPPVSWSFDSGGDSQAIALLRSG
jgi:hypothetical protein